MKRALLFSLCLVFALCAASCAAEENEGQLTYIKWETIEGIPEGFPKLCDEVTTVDIGGSRVSLLWNVLDEEVYNSYKEKVESYAGTKFEFDGLNYSLTTEKDGVSYKIIFNRDGKQSGKHVEGALWETQAKLSIIKE